MSASKTIVSAALARVGWAERPDGSNDDGGGPITRVNRRYGLRYEPWCAMWCGEVYDAAGSENGTAVVHPYTGTIYERAKARGWIGKPKPGGMLLWPGKHVEILIAPANRERTLWHTAGGNISDASRRQIRSISGAVCVELPELTDDADAPDVKYFLEDPAARNRLLGPWRGKRGLAHARRVSKQRPRSESPRVVHLGKQRFGVIIGPRKHYGPWLDKDERDRARSVLEKRLGRKLRPYRSGAGMAGQAEDLGKVS